MLCPVIPVRHHQARIAPFLPQNAGNQFPVFRGVGAVQQIVGGHNAPNAAFFHDDLKGFQVNFPQRPLRNPGIASEAVGLLVVAAEVLDAGRNILGLNALHHCRRQLPGHQRVFRIILKVPAAQGASVDVDGRGQPHADVVFLNLFRSRLPHLIKNFRVPGAGKQCRHRPGRGIHPPVGEDPQTRRAVGGHHGGNAQVVQSADAPGIRHPPVGCAAQEGNQLVIRQAVQEHLHGHFPGGHLFKVQPSLRRVDTPHIGKNVFCLPVGLLRPPGGIIPGWIRPGFQFLEAAVRFQPPGKLRGNAAVLQLPNHPLFFVMEIPHYLRRADTIARQNGICPRRKHIGSLLFIIGSQVPGGERQGQLLGFSGRQKFGLLECPQLQHRHLQAAFRRGAVDLHHFPARRVSRIRHPDRNKDFFVVPLGNQRFQ